MLLIVCSNFEYTTQGATYHLYVFEGSDWCPNCLRLERQVLSTSIFEEAMVNHRVNIEKVDFPQRKKLSKQLIHRNDSLATVYQFDGTFPTLVLSRTDTLLYLRIKYMNQSAEDLRDEIISKTQKLND